MKYKYWKYNFPGGGNDNIYRTDERGCCRFNIVNKSTGTQGYSTRDFKSFSYWDEISEKEFNKILEVSGLSEHIVLTTLKSKIMRAF